MARLHVFFFCLVVAAPRTQLLHFCTLFSALIDHLVQPYYMLIAQAEVLVATESAHHNLISPLFPSLAVSSVLRLQHPSLFLFLSPYLVNEEIKVVS